MHGGRPRLQDPRQPGRGEEAAGEGEGIIIIVMSSINALVAITSCRPRTRARVTTRPGRCGSGTRRGTLWCSTSRWGDDDDYDDNEDYEDDDNNNDDEDEDDNDGDDNDDDV